MTIASTLLWLFVATPASADPGTTPAEVPTGPAEVMLLYGDVKSTVHVAGVTTKVPANVELPQGTHEVRIVTSTGQVVMKVIRVEPPTENTQVIDLGKAQAAAVPGHTFRFEVKGGGEGLTLLVDGIEGGAPPLEVLLSPGPHIVELQRADGTKTGGEMTLTASGEGPTVVSLTP